MTQFLTFEIPAGVSWGDYFACEFTSTSSASSTDAAEEVVSDSEWEMVGKKKVRFEEPLPTTRPAKWCKHGNACVWKNCPFRHEVCGHHAKWLANGKSGKGCRCLETDPESNKSPENGGCKYDHRDISKLRVYSKTLPVSDEGKLWDAFYPLGLEPGIGHIYDTSKMAKFDKALLIRSLESDNGVEFEDYDLWVEIVMPV